MFLVNPRNSEGGETGGIGSEEEKLSPLAPGTPSCAAVLQTHRVVFFPRVHSSQSLLKLKSLGNFVGGQR